MKIQNTKARFSELVPGTWTTIPSPITPQVDKKKPFSVPYRVFSNFGSEKDKIRKAFPHFFGAIKLRNFPVVNKIQSQLVWCSFFFRKSSSKESKELSEKRFITFLFLFFYLRFWFWQKWISRLACQFHFSGFGKYFRWTFSDFENLSLKLGKKQSFLRLHQTLSRSQKLGRNEVAFSTAFYFYEFLFFLSEKANRTFN